MAGIDGTWPNNTAIKQSDGKMAMARGETKRTAQSSLSLLQRTSSQAASHKRRLSMSSLMLQSGHDSTSSIPIMPGSFKTKIEYSRGDSHHCSRPWHQEYNSGDVAGQRGDRDAESRKSPAERYHGGRSVGDLYHVEWREAPNWR